MNQYVIRSNQGSRFNSTAFGSEGKEVTYESMEEASEVMGQIQSLFKEEQFLVYELDETRKKVTPLN